MGKTKYSADLFLKEYYQRTFSSAVPCQRALLSLSVLVLFPNSSSALFVFPVYTFTMDIKKETTIHSIGLLFEKWFAITNP